MPDDRLEQALNAMRAEQADPAEMEAARGRVWEKLLSGESPLCAEFRGELAAYLAGELAAARALLFEDHLSRCAGCRKAYNEARGARKVMAMPVVAARKPRPAWMKYAMAAGVALVMLALGRGPIDRALAPSGPRATVESLSGPLYQLAGGPLQAGAALGDGEFIRTGLGARAVLRLADGSRLEMNERTELAFEGAWSGATVRLERGDVILEAAKQRRGHLRVRTRDSEALVKGTIFAVSTGTAGSLVSVVEGAVEVRQPGTDRVLKPGELAASSPALAAVPVRQSVAWSAESEKYFSLLAEFLLIERQIAGVLHEGVRTESRLLPLLPADPFIYVAVPNIGRAIDETVRLIEQRSNENAALKEWWGSASAVELRKELDRVQTVTPLLGEEIAFVVTRTADGKGFARPLMLAEVKSGREAELRQALTDLFAASGGQGAFDISNGRVVLADSAAALRTPLGAGATTPFAADIATHYQRGAGWLLAMNLAATDLNVGAEAEAMGFSGMKHLFFEQRAPGGRTENEASISFAGARTGIASWLAAPAASGSAEYATANAILVMSASTRNPRQAFDELIAALGRVSSNIPEELRKFEEKAGVSVSQDLAAALGTDFTVAIERPSLPVPGWVGAFEVPQPALLDLSLRRLVDSFNRELPADKVQFRLTLAEQQEGGRVWTTVKSAASPHTLYWTHDRGYLIVSQDRALAAQAIQTRDGGLALVRSARFVQQLPATGSMHHSAFIWVNPEGPIADVAQLLSDGTLKALLQNSEPVLITLDGETERIRAASRTRLMNLVLGLTMTAHTHTNATSH